MFKEYEEVRIKRNGVTGIIVDKTVRDGRNYYIVESNKKGPIEGGYGDLWPLFDCEEEELQKLQTDEVMPVSGGYEQAISA